MPRVVITGANRGLCRACTDEFADAGWTVIALTRNQPSNSCASGGPGVIRWIRHNLCDPIEPELLDAGESPLTDAGCIGTVGDSGRA